MKKLYLLLDNELKLCITVDRCIILYKEYEYTESILDQLYSKIAAHNVDEAIERDITAHPVSSEAERKQLAE